MKKIIYAIFAVFLVFGFVKTNVAKAQDNQLDPLVSPRVWVIGANAVEEITVHVAYPYSESLDVVLLVDDYFPQFRTFADDRGDLVIRFKPEISTDDVGDNHILTVKIGELGELYDKDADFSVKELGPTMPDGGVVILEGDKVRGDEGVGEVNQNQTEDPNCWDVNFCTPDGSFGD
ncbi:hypothetical protein ACFLZ1_01375 [Patescibacteria group bacterium]